jgi:hypothetical protein
MSKRVRKYKGKVGFYKGTLPDIVNTGKFWIGYGFEPFVYIGGERTSNLTTYKYDLNGNAITGQSWPRDHGANLFFNAIGVDTYGNVITGGTAASGVSVRKYKFDGSLLWSKDIGSGQSVNGVAIGKDNRIYVAVSGNNQLTRIYSPSGTLLSSFAYGGTNYNTSRIFVDLDNNILICGQATGENGKMKKFNPDFTVAWDKATDSTNTFTTVAADKDGNVYTGSNVFSSNTTRKYNSAGTLQWERNHGNEVFGIVVANNGDVYTAGSKVDQPNTIRKYNSAGTLQWSSTTGGSFGLYTISIDANNNIYVGGDRQGSTTVWKLNSSGTVLWQRNLLTNVFSIQVIPLPLR